MNLFPLLKVCLQNFSDVHRGEWKLQGINSWNDLLQAAFSVMNRGKYVGEKGLKRAQALLREILEEQGRLPIAHDKGMAGICTAVQQGEWKLQGINSWNDLLQTTFGEVNRGNYVGKEGLKRAQALLLDFFEKQGRLPTSNDKGMATIRTAIRQGYWDLQGLKTWKDLLKKTFGRV